MEIAHVTTIGRFEAKFTVANGGPAAITSWHIEFDLPAGTALGSYWDALVTRTGDHYVATNREYNGNVGVGAYDVYRGGSVAVFGQRHHGHRDGPQRVHHVHVHGAGA
ncbi:cellulose binding domain-containing protein [Saccharothrix deserti]|uniref:cellulose binding domain-containing protein n=1 Tax=Saccharothrix deserti TaxID=2593674 RepID=UPI001EE47828|nr:cellulose binding domain-containing protein [Saccharothrix deserti]